MDTSFDSVAVASRLYNRGSMLLTSSFEAIEIADDVFNKIYSKTSDRVVHLQLLSLFLRSNGSGNVEGKLCMLVEKLPGLIESAITVDLQNALLEVVDALLSTGSTEIVNRFGKISSRLINIIMRLSLVPDHLEFALSLLLSLTDSMRSLILPHVTAVRQVCLNLLVHPPASSKSARILASIYGLESAESWANNWCGFCNSMAKCLFEMGVFIGGLNKVAVLKEADLFVSPPSSSGHSKALFHERKFKGISAVLISMLETGCCTGYPSIDVSKLIAVVSTLLSLHIEASPSDPKAVIENEFGLSPADLIAVSSQLKIHCISVVSALLRTQHRSLLRVATAFYRPVASLLGSREAKAIPALAVAAVECLSCAIKCFPTVVARSASTQAAGPTTLVEFFQLEIAALTTSKAVLTSQVVEQELLGDRQAASGHTATAAGPEVVFDAVETLLLFCGPMLPAAVREAMEGALAQALVCLGKGIMPPQSGDKRMRRAPCETLRQSPALQVKLLRIAAVELMCPAAGGVLSGNAALLRRACEATLRQAETSSEAARALLVVETILNPCTVSLPSASAIVTARKLMNSAEWTSAYAPAGGVSGQQLREGEIAGQNLQQQKQQQQQQQLDESWVVGEKKQQHEYGMDGSRFELESLTSHSASSSRVPERDSGITVGSVTLTPDSHLMTSHKRQREDDKGSEDFGKLSSITPSRVERSIESVPVLRGGNNADGIGLVEVTAPSEGGGRGIHAADNSMKYDFKPAKKAVSIHGKSSSEQDDDGDDSDIPDIDAEAEPDASWK